jgi:hypothetical protein
MSCGGRGRHDATGILVQERRGIVLLALSATYGGLPAKPMTAMLPSALTAIDLPLAVSFGSPPRERLPLLAVRRELRHEQEAAHDVRIVQVREHAAAHEYLAVLRHGDVVAGAKPHALPDEVAKRVNLTRTMLCRDSPVSKTLPVR